MAKTVLVLLLLITGSVFAVAGLEDHTLRARDDHVTPHHQNRTAIILACLGFLLVLIGMAVLAWYRANRAPSTVPHQPTADVSVVEHPVEIELFPISTVGEEAAQLQGTECPWCIEMFEEGEQYRTLPCSHVLHDGCMASYLAVIPGVRPFTTWPVCRASLV